MDSSQISGGDEECQSSESGWTMYLGSPADADKKNDDDDNQHGDYGDNSNHNDGSDNDDYSGDNTTRQHYHDGDSDDSMASDASSGPKNLGPRRGKGQSNTTGHGRLAVHKPEEEDEEAEDEDDKYRSERKGNRVANKRTSRRKVK